MNINRVLLIGNLTADPELFEAGKSKIVNASLASHQFYENGQEERQEVTTFVDLKIWGRPRRILRNSSGKVRKFWWRVRCDKIDGKMTRGTNVQSFM